jgi:hypothetical protein
MAQKMISYGITLILTELTSDLEKSANSEGKTRQASEEDSE